LIIELFRDKKHIIQLINIFDVFLIENYLENFFRESFFINSFALKFKYVWYIRNL
jgi:hypothetical protein